jgi:outer membrane protein assembly factor BamB
VFVGSNEGDFYALDEASGVTLWKRTFGWQPKTTCFEPMGVASTAAVRDDGRGDPLVYVNAPDGYLYELDGLTGATIWRSVVAIPSTTANDYFAWSSPLLLGGRVYVGIASACDIPLVRGALEAYDQTTGAPLATYFTVPTGAVGGGIWTSAAGDANALYVTTGSVNDTNPPAGDQYAIVKLTPSSLAVSAKFTVPTAERVGDGDFGSSPVLFHARLAGADTQMVGACNKNGVFYAVRTDTMQLVWERRLGAVASWSEACFAGGTWDGTHLLVGGDSTIINGVPAAGSVRSLDPAAGTILWETPLAAPIMGAGTINSSGVAAFTTADWSQSANACYLLEVSTGRILRTIVPPGNTADFAQPVWVDHRLLVTTLGATRAYW